MKTFTIGEYVSKFAPRLIVSNRFWAIGSFLYRLIPHEDMGFHEWMEQSSTLPLSGQKIELNDQIYIAQIVRLFGRIKHGEFALQPIVFSTKEIPSIEESFIFLYDDRFSGIPVFFPIKQGLSPEKKQKMHESFCKNYDRIANAILYKRTLSAYPVNTGFGIVGDNTFVFDMCKN